MALYYEPRKINLVFFITNLILLFTFVAWAWRELHPEWRSYQEQFLQLQRSRLMAKIREEEKRLEGLAEYRQAKERLVKAEAVLRSPAFRRLQAEVKTAEKALKKAQDDFQNERARVIQAEDEMFYARSPEAKEFWRRKLEEHQQRSAQLEKNFLAWEQRVEALHARMTSLTKEYDEAKAAVEQMERDLALLRTNLESLKKQRVRIQQILVEPLRTVDRCTTCHLGIDKKDFDDPQVPLVFRYHPRYEELIAIHPIERFGCTSCHRGQGRALGKDAAHGFQKHWEKPFLPKEYREAGCNDCHMEQMEIRGAPRLTAGKRLFQGLGCVGCHDAPGFDNHSKAGPSLEFVASKLTPEWAFAWLKDPHAFYPNTRMPQFFLSNEEAEAIVAFLFSVSRSQVYSQPDLSQADPRRGKHLFDTVGCRGCHSLQDPPQLELTMPATPASEPRPGDQPFVPDLSFVGTKVNPAWLYAWIRNPKHYNPQTRMPDLRLTPQEAADITAYLLQQRRADWQPGVSNLRLSDPEVIRRGEQLVRYYGCFGCHTIPGMEKEAKIGVDLSDWGYKDVHFLDFGAKVHEIPHTREAWLVAKLKDPRQFREGLRMPNFKLTEEEVHLIATAVLGFTKEWEHLPAAYVVRLTPGQQEAERGRRLVWNRNCRGCHIIEGTGGFIYPNYEEGLQPPNLQSEGQRVSPDWLFRFLKDPTLGMGQQHALRPWLTVRMPTFHFTDEETNSIIHYFAEVDKEPLLALFRSPHVPNPQLAKTGKELFEVLQCMKCHPTGPVEVTAEGAGQLAPNLQLARERLQPEWVVEWLLDPQAFQPNTRMPTFFPQSEGQFISPFPNILGGDARKQAEALRDYIWTLALPAPKAGMVAAASMEGATRSPMR